MLQPTTILRHLQFPNSTRVQFYAAPVSQALPHKAAALCHRHQPATFLSCSLSCTAVLLLYCSCIVAFFCGSSNSRHKVLRAVGWLPSTQYPSSCTALLLNLKLHPIQSAAVTAAVILLPVIVCFFPGHTGHFSTGPPPKSTEFDLGYVRCI